jgi:hypothetical protein
VADASGLNASASDDRLAAELPADGPDQEILDSVLAELSE